MSDNPRITIANEIPAPPQPVIVRETFTQITFANEYVAVYAEDIDPNALPVSFEPTSPTSHFFWNMLYAYQRTGFPVPPDFVDLAVWDKTLKTSPSGFVTAVNSVMPKLIVPSQVVCANGFYDCGTDKEAKNVGGDFDGTHVFDWRVSLLGGATPTAEQKKIDLVKSPKQNSSYISVKYKNDSTAGTAVANTLQLLEPTAPKPEGEWEPTTLVVEGAFCLMLNPVTWTTGKSTPDDAEKKWSVTFTFGEVVIKLDESGSLTTNIGTETTRAQLSDSQAKETLPQAKQLTNPLVIVIYPVWNGVIVQSGIQDTKAVVASASQFCIKDREVSISDEAYQQQGPGGATGRFDPNNPAPVFIKTTSDVKVNFGSSIVAVTENCRFELAYVPLFFSNAAVLDSFFIGQRSHPGDPEEGELPVTYEYTAYPIWTDNDTSYTSDYSMNTLKEIDEDTEWRYIRFTFEADKPNRRAGELFGYILRTSESRETTTHTDNGSFELNVTDGTPAAPWQDYIKSVSVTTGLDGISGQVVVDKYGFAGQSAVPVQDIGALVLTVSRAPASSVTGTIFSGIAMGISDTQSSEGGEFTIPLVGLHQKMEDIVLINVPFFDGERFGYVAQFLANYCGLIPNFGFASTGDILPASDDITAPLIDFKTGTTVADAMNQLMEFSAHNFVFQPDGQVYFYKLATDGLPVTLGTDWEPDYPDTKVISIDKTPDFEDLRNEALVIGLQQVGEPERQRATVQEYPTIPLILQYTNYGITPPIPWSKPMVYGIPGYVTESILQRVMDQIEVLTKIYELTGRTTIPGNAQVKPYDRWGDYVIVSVTQNVDLEGKTWTTDLEFASGRTS